MDDSDGEWGFILYKDPFYLEYEIPALPMPLRTGALQRMTEAGGVSIDDLLDEMLEYLNQRPDEMARYGPAVGKLSYVVGTAHGKAGDHGRASFYLARSFAVDPSETAYRWNYAQSLFKCARYRECLTICLEVVDLGSFTDQTVLFAKMVGMCREKLREADGGGTAPGKMELGCRS